MEVTGKGKGLPGPKKRIGTEKMQGKNLGQIRGWFWKPRGALEGGMVWGLTGGNEES